MFYITLARYRKKLTKQMYGEMQKLFSQATEAGGKIHGIYFTLGRYDGVVISEVPNGYEKGFIRHLLRFGEFVSTETLVAVPAEKVSDLVE